MHYHDRVYGDAEITEDVLVALIESSSLQRLKDIDQAGYPEPYYPGSAHSRFEHSMGVMLLLRRFGASLEEQIAGLIHDVSHSAFSHCIDYALAGVAEEKHSHQDDIFEGFVRTSEIPAILERHHIDLERILDDANFPLKERDLPDLCADRIDYSLRQAVVCGHIPDGSQFLQRLSAEDGHWVFADVESAASFAELFLLCNTRYWAGLTSAVMFRTVGDTLRHALAQTYISEADLYTTDEAVLRKILPRATEDATLALLLARMNGEVGYTNDPDDFTARVSCKSRAVDPLCRNEGEVCRLSDVRPEWKNTLTQESTPKEYFLKFER